MGLAENRWDYMYHALTGKYDPIMASVKKDWDARTGDNSFGRLECLVTALTRWTIWDSKRGFVMLLPAGHRGIWIDHNAININVGLFSFYWTRHKTW